MEVILLSSILLVAVGAFLLESASPETVRIIAISGCFLLITLMAVGMYFRARAKKRRALMESAAHEESNPE